MSAMLCPSCAQLFCSFQRGEIVGRKSHEKGAQLFCAVLWTARVNFQVTNFGAMELNYHLCARNRPPDLNTGQSFYWANNFAMHLTLNVQFVLVLAAKKCIS